MQVLLAWSSPQCRQVFVRWLATRSELSLFVSLSRPNKRSEVSIDRARPSMPFRVAGGSPLLNISCCSSCRSFANSILACTLSLVYPNSRSSVCNSAAKSSVVCSFPCCAFSYATAALSCRFFISQIESKRCVLNCSQVVCPGPPISSS